jgi:hypothetical protein
VCTLIAGLGILGPGTLVVGANRDESPDRPTAGPGVLLARPRVVGGRDLLSGGTWLAVREGRFLSALMNRRPVAGDARDPATFRSRGLLCLDAAAAPAPLDAPDALDPGTGERHSPRLDAALRLLAGGAYGHCTLVGMGVDGEGWAIHSGHGAEPEVTPIGPGWHVVTHAEVDDRGEPRTRRLLERLEAACPRGEVDALDLFAGLLRIHAEGEEPAVCLHRERFPTVSSSLLALGAVGTPRYLHAAGPPCVTPYEDRTDLLR